ncbi:hypothetical protein L332_08770 [Agrococcus pavilionensis RW1]|uniref:Uncharacterized protein n=1 Tax=Agrococcus pavilionensis RW1 TaxID=1330458 RepID=U1LQ23_9MICO|nr:hypothetical protein L332_08770 [Agrococcus pavilionensis RW1]
MNRAAATPGRSLRSATIAMTHSATTTVSMRAIATGPSATSSASHAHAITSPRGTRSSSASATASSAVTSSIHTSGSAAVPKALDARIGAHASSG